MCFAWRVPADVICDRAVLRNWKDGLLLANSPARRPSLDENREVENDGEGSRAGLRVVIGTPVTVVPGTYKESQM